MAALSHVERGSRPGPGIMSRVLLAFDSFRGTLSAAEACEAAARGIAAEIGDVDIRMRPLADGGDGTSEVLAGALGGHWRTVEVTHPLGDRSVQAAWLHVGDPSLRAPEAVVEMARGSGLVLVPPALRDPLVTTTAGTGELIRAALDGGARRIWLTLGGSATVDGGMGAAAALGWRFLDARGRPVVQGGGGLRDIVRIHPPARRLDAEVTALCDVDNPLLGPRGAAAVFGPQKGATPADVERLEEGLAHLARLVRDQLGLEIARLEGAGAAGGFAAGAVAFLGGVLARGIDRILDAVAFDDALREVDWVLTGEGRLDTQSLDGKVVSGVLDRCRRRGVRVGAVAGRVALSPGQLREAGLEWARASAPDSMDDEGALSRAAELVEAAAARFARECLAASRP